MVWFTHTVSSDIRWAATERQANTPLRLCASIRSKVMRSPERAVRPAVAALGGVAATP
ncbi:MULTISPECIES: hypothetical protein [unclassified Streptomyces]|uniref:hypothetical protein n=1 Tax=unclassified Streptomyces TaxID=2593676 RepID=UPI00136D7D96|nr:hypothetical protein [Streptomyces sp. SID6139]MYR23249.1 hypothetical protein [Streptomyces sp. SID6137]